MDKADRTSDTIVRIGGAVLKLLLLLLTFSAAYAGIDAKLVGEWVTTASGTGARVVLKIAADGRCSVGADSGKCQSMLRLLVVQTASGPATTYSYQVKNDKLTVAGGGLAQAMVFERSTGEPAPAVAAAPEPTAAINARPQAPPVPSAGRYSHQFWGLSFAVPGAWKANERDGMVLLGSDTEAGLIIVRFERSVNKQMMLTEYSKGLSESGVTLTPATRAEDYAAGANRGVAGELAGMAGNSSQLRARVIAVQSQFGDAAIILGLTTQEKYAALKPRVEEIAASVAFTQPRTPPANQMVAGNYYWIYVSTSGGNYSREDKLMLCANGMFSRGGETYSSGSAGMAGLHSGYSGSWSADGDGQNGTITLRYRNGKTESLRYQKSGLDIVLNGKKYGRNGDGACSGR